MKLDLHYVDPRLVELYDSTNPRGADTDFYIQLAADLNAQTILDLGCGTGLLTRELAVGDRQGGARQLRRPSGRRRHRR